MYATRMQNIHNTYFKKFRQILGNLQLKYIHLGGDNIYKYKVFNH
jgi:hypothetical protein